MDPHRKREFKDRVYAQIERVTKALASRRRLELLDLLAQGEATVEELAEETEMSVQNTSQHLKVLRESRLARVRRRGTYAYYRAASPEIVSLCQTVRRVAEAHLAEMDRIAETYLLDSGRMDALSVEELRRRLDDGAVVVLDVRPEDEYRAGHIPGARSIPVDELERRLDEIPEDTDVVAYCRGPYCVLSDEAVQTLEQSGRSAYRLEVGLPEWETAGHPVERGDGAGPTRQRR